MTNQFGELLQNVMPHKWVTAPDQHADHAGQTLLTRDHAAIRAWAEARHAEPATGIGKVDINDGGAAIRFAFPGVGRLQPISWDDWFRNFDEYNLVFVFEEQSDERLQSHKYRLIPTEELPQYGAETPPPKDESRTMSAESGTPSPSEARRPARSRTGWLRTLNILPGRASPRR